MTQTQFCSEPVWSIGEGVTCSRKGVAVRDGKLYCRQHDPEERKRKEAVARSQREATCWHQERFAPKCGNPAVAVEYGYGRCADHTQEALAARQRLNEAAPDMLVVLQLVARLAETADLPGPIYLSIEERNQIRAAIAKATGGQP